MKNYTDVVIDNKMYTVGSDQDSAYMQQLAEYVNEKLSSMRGEKSFQKQPYGTRQALILMNLADDYLSMKLGAEELRKKYEAQEEEFYSMKMEFANMKLQMEQLRLQNQVLSMEISKDSGEKERIMAEVISKVQKDTAAASPQVSAKEMQNRPAKQKR